MIDSDSTSFSSVGVGVRRLRYFIAVAEEMHFGRAARRLNVAQPALSRQIAQLEAALAAPLFDRARSQIKMTQAAEVLLPYAKDILRRIDQAALAARRAAQGGTGLLNIGFVGSATYSILPDILKAYRSAYPKVEVMLHAMNTSELRQALVERGIDAAFARPSIRDSEIVNETILTEPLIVALPDDDPLAKEASVPLDALRQRAFVLYPRHPRPSFADRIIDICKASGFVPAVAQETMELQTALGLVAVGVGVSLVPASVERSHRHGVAYRPLASPAPTTDLSLSFRRDNNSPLLNNFRAMVENVMAHTGPKD
jgi:DNA-binding transcriptional LysR family regulator